MGEVLYTAIVLTVIGACVGSFIVCWAYRYNRGISIVWVKHSFCESCKKELTFWELIPVFNYIITKGKCRECGAKYSPLSTYIELFMAVFFPVIFFSITNTTYSAMVVFIGCFITFYSIVIADKLSTVKEMQKVDDSNNI